MARQKKQGIDYFSLDCDFFSDRKIKILKSRYGADGITIFIYLLCEIYRNGYYIIVDDDFYYIVSDDLNMNSDKVKQVLTFLLERSMFDKQLFQSDAVLTSAGIQKRFQLAVKTRAKKNPIKVDRFWLLNEEETEPFIKVTHFEDNSENNTDNSKKNNDNSREESLKESKVKESKYYYSNPDLNREFCLYLDMRNHTGPTLSAEQINALKEELDSLAENDSDKLGIVRKAFGGGYKSFFPTSKKRKKSTPKPKKEETIHNFTQREVKDCDYENLEKQLLKKQFGDDIVYG